MLYRVVHRHPSLFPPNLPPKSSDPIESVPEGLSVSQYVPLAFWSSAASCQRSPNQRSNEILWFTTGAPRSSAEGHKAAGIAFGSSDFQATHFNGQTDSRVPKVWN
jgi:hypothetical protein